MAHTDENINNLYTLLLKTGFDLDVETFFDAYNNRKDLKLFCEQRCGVYVMQAQNDNIYDGRSTNLQSHIRSYFLPSVLKRKAQRVLFFFNKYGFKDVRLHVFRLRPPVDINTIIRYEQAALDHHKPSLNVEAFARSTRYAQPLGHSEQSKGKRSKPVYVYDLKGVLLFVFRTKQEAIQQMRNHHTSLNQYSIKCFI